MDAPPIQYVQTADGWDIAYTVCGEGVPLMYMPAHLLSHVRLLWGVQPQYSALAGRFTLVSYDSRGGGMSSRGLADGFGAADFELDLEAVADCVGVKQFVLMAFAGKSRVAVRFAVRHPERVLGLILWNPNTGDPALDVHEAPPRWFQEAARSDWDQFVRTMARAAFLFVEPRVAETLIRESITQADCLRQLAAWDQYVVADDLLRLQVPTLVIAPSASDTPFSGEEASRRIAARIPGARLATFEAATGPDRFVLIIEDFVRTLPNRTAEADAASGLSTRELEVLRLLAAGRSNQKIADQLVIRPSTVAKHITHILAKTESANRGEAAAYAHRHRLV